MIFELLNKDGVYADYVAAIPGKRHGDFMFIATWCFEDGYGYLRVDYSPTKDGEAYDLGDDELITIPDIETFIDLVGEDPRLAECRNA